MNSEAFVTLCTNDRYALGALVLAHSLKIVNTAKQLCVLVTPTVSELIRRQLSDVYDKVVCVDVLNSNDSAHLSLLKRPELGVTFTKLHCWTLTNYSKCVFLDADMMAVRNADELFEEPELSAACDVGWPDCFNSGMFVFSPSQDTYNRLLQQAGDTGSFDGGDQGLLNTFFTNWNRLSFVYNMVASASYTYLPAYKQYGKDVKFVHFLGAIKPWNQTYRYGYVSSKPGQEHISSHLNAWWRIYSDKVQQGVPTTGTYFQPSFSETPILSQDPVRKQIMVPSSSFSSNLSNTCCRPSALPTTSRPIAKDIDLPTTGTKAEALPTVSTQDTELPGTVTKAVPMVLPSGSSTDLPLKEPPFHKPSSGYIEIYSCEPTQIAEKVSEQLMNLTLESPSTSSSATTPSDESKKRWEQGTPDYLGEESFENIQAFLDSKIQ